MSNKKSATSSKDSRFNPLSVGLLAALTVWTGLTLSSCREPKPQNDDEIPGKAVGPKIQGEENAAGLNGKIPENFVKLYLELRLATTGNPNHPERARESRKIIMEKYKMSLKDYRNHVETLKQQPEVWTAFYEKVLNELDVLEKRHKGE